MESKALVQQHSGLPVGLALEEFEGHRWFAQSNYEQAVEHAQGTFYAHELGLQKQAEVHVKKLGDLLAYDRSLMVVDIGRDMNFDCKLFGVMEPVDKNMVKVESRRFNWCVFALSQTDVAVPPEHLKRILEFEKQGFCFNGFGIAVPETVEYEPVILGLRRAARETWDVVKKRAAGSLGLTIAGGMALGVTGGAVVKALALAIMTLPDPVLLGLVCSRLPGSKIFLVEIGRWE